ncbi:hypothetical protein ACHWQZ_G016899 [Mnemiopsis leidyi]
MKCLLLGDKGSGKNSLALTFLLGKCPDIIPSNSFNSYTKCFDGVIVEVQVSCKVNPSNSAFCSQYFSELDAILLCFAVNDPCTFDSVQQYWFHIVREHAAHAQFFLVGLKSDTLPYVELSPSAVLRTPSVLLRTPTMTSIKNAINGRLTRTPVTAPTEPEPTPDNQSCNGASTRPDTSTRPETSVRADTPYPRGENVITRELGNNLARQLGCVEYIECTVKEEFDGPYHVENLFTKVVNKTRKADFGKMSNKVESQICVIL